MLLLAPSRADVESSLWAGAPLQQLIHFMTCLFGRKWSADRIVLKSLHPKSLRFVLDSVILYVSATSTWKSWTYKSCQYLGNLKSQTCFVLPVVGFKKYYKNKRQFSLISLPYTGLVLVVKWWRNEAILFLDKFITVIDFWHETTGYFITVTRIMPQPLLPRHDSCIFNIHAYLHIVYIIQWNMFV